MHRITTDSLRGKPTLHGAAEGATENCTEDEGGEPGKKDSPKMKPSTSSGTDASDSDDECCSLSAETLAGVRGGTEEGEGLAQVFAAEVAAKDRQTFFHFPVNRWTKLRRRDSGKDSLHKSA